MSFIQQTLDCRISFRSSLRMPEVLTSEGPVAADEPDLSIFENKSGLAEDLKFLASMPELCDVTFLVGETREPVCAVKVQAAFSSQTSPVVRWWFEISMKKSRTHKPPKDSFTML